MIVNSTTTTTTTLLDDCRETFTAARFKYSGKKYDCKFKFVYSVDGVDLSESKVIKCETNAKGTPQPQDKQITTPCGAVIEVDLKVKNIKNGVSKKVTLKSAELISIDPSCSCYVAPTTTTTTRTSTTTTEIITTTTTFDGNNANSSFVFVT